MICAFILSKIYYVYICLKENVMKYSNKYKVLGQFTDADGVLKTGALLRYMQETAADAMEADGPSYDELAERGLIFVISKINISVYADIFAHDEIEVETWATESVRASFHRAYRVLRDGVVIAEAVSVWALVDKSRCRLVRAGDVELHYREDESLELDTPQKLRMPESMTLRGERRVSYSDCDRNRHMNNTVYADMICDYVFNRDIGRVSRLSINYVNEAPFGEELKVYVAREDDTYYVRTIREDGKVNIEAEVLV